MATFIHEQITLEHLTCGGCGITFAAPVLWLKDKRDNGGSFRCPNGCSRIYREGENTKLRRERDALRARIDQRDAALRDAEKEKSNLRGQITKAKNRAANGVCPCCTRSFTNLRRHMSTKHPDYAKGATP